MNVRQEVEKLLSAAEKVKEAEDSLFTSKTLREMCFQLMDI